MAAVPVVGMSSTDDLLREVDPEREGRSADRESRSRRARLHARAGRVFSLRRFLAALAVAAVGLLLAGLVVPGFVPLGGLLGVFAAAFALGLAGWRRYVEFGFAGAAVAAVALLLDYVALSVLGAVTAFGAGSGALVALLGHYFGRDLRDGLTRDL